MSTTREDPTALNASSQQQLARRERLLTKDLETSRDKLWAQSQALAERSRIRTVLGDKLGALRDAKGALALFPTRVEYLARASEALLNCGHNEKACKALDRAKAILDGEGSDDGDHGNDDDAGVRNTLARIDKYLRPLDYLPNEVLARVFELVYAHWERLPSPFQLCHVSQRWRDLAHATPSLWRDLRILRIDKKFPTDDLTLSSKARRPYLYTSDDNLPEDRCIHPRDQNHAKLIQECARRSKDSLTYFEVHALQSDLDPVLDVLNVAQRSAATLTGLSIAHNGEADYVAPFAFRLVLQCPRLAHLSLNLGRVNVLDVDETERIAKDLAPLPSTIRSLELDSTECFSTRLDSHFAQLILQQCSRVERLRISDNESAGLSEPGVKIVALSAESLVDLEISAQSGLFERLNRIGVRSLPSLRRFRHLSTLRGDDYHFDDFKLLDLPKLECVEGPLRLIQVIKSLPKRVVLRCDHLNLTKVEAITGWLRGPLAAETQLDEVEELTIEFLEHDEQDVKQFHRVIDALTPGVTGKVVCPKLSRFSVLVRDKFARGGEVNRLAVDSMAQPTPLFREQWESKLDLSRVLWMVDVRRKVAAGVPYFERFEYQAVAPTSAFQRGPRTTASEAKAAAAPAASAPRCVALKSIVLEGCYVEEAAWKAMKCAMSADVCHYDVTPDPELMAMLPFEGTKRKKARLGERRVHAW